MSIKTHGLRKHRLYNIWNMMMQRCYNVNNNAYKHYGARGIKVCDRWHNVSNFIDDMFPGYQDGLTIDRINNNGNYEPSNCRWANANMQRRNTRILRADNKTGFRGVYCHKNTNKYVARITINRRSIHIGCFTTSLNAARAYDKYVIDNNLEHTLNFN